MAAPVIEDADSLRAVRGNGVLLLRDDAPLSQRGTSYLLGADAPTVPPALAAVSSKFGVIFVSSMSGASRRSDRGPGSCPVDTFMLPPPPRAPVQVYLRAGRPTRSTPTPARRV